MMPGYLNSDSYSIRVEDGAGVGFSLTDLTGDPDLGEETPDQREYVDVMARNKAVGRFQGAEKATKVTFEALASTLLDTAIDFMLARGPVYGAGGTAPMVTVDLACGAPAVILKITKTPPRGGAKIITWGRAYLTTGEKGANEGSKRPLNFDCFTRSIT